MKHWWQFDSDEERLAYIRSVRRLTEFSDKDPDYKKKSKHYPLGEVAYFENEMYKLRSEGISKGGLVRSWIEDDKCKAFQNVEKVILKLWIKHKEEVEKNWNNSDPRISFDKQLFTFFRIYFPYRRLSRLLTEVQRQTSKGDLLHMVNDQLHFRFKSNLKDLDENNFRNWKQGEFAAACRYIYDAKRKEDFTIYSDNPTKPQSYIIKPETSFERFKREMAAYYQRETPSHTYNKAGKELEKLQRDKKILLRGLFR